MKTIDVIGKNYFGRYTKTREACRGIVMQDGKILLSHELNSGWWLIPGGGLEAGETLAECCRREVLEETGYLVRVEGPFLTLNEYYEEWRYVSHYFVCEVLGQGEQRLTGLEQERGLIPEWVPLEQAISMFGKHQDYAANEEKRGSYLREFRALSEYLEQHNR